MSRQQLLSLDEQCKTEDTQRLKPVHIEDTEKSIEQRISEIDAEIKDFHQEYQSKIDKLETERTTLLKQLNPNMQIGNNNQKMTGSKTKPLRETEMVNAIDVMKNGATFLKYGRSGFPHFRQFELSQDAKYIIWYSENKTVDKSRVALAEVIYLQPGQLTTVFQKHLKPKQAERSFSLIYADGLRTLDMIAKKKSTYNVWKTGLEKLLEYHKKVKSYPDMKFPTDVWVNINKKLNDKQRQQMINRKSSEPDAKHIEQELCDAKKRFAKLSAISMDSRLNAIEIPEMETARTRLVELEQDVEKIEDLAKDKDSLKVASRDIWKTAIELRALEVKIEAISKTYCK